MSLLFYNIFLQLYHTCIKVLSLWNPKAKLWVKSRKPFPAVNYTNTKHEVVWMHCASLGEFEQGRPLLEAIRSNYANCKIVISFFSPSGYQIVKNFKGADDIIYLPGDSSSNARRLINQVNPTLVLWVKYEYWFYYLTELKRKNIPILLISGVYRNSMPFFKWYGSLWKRMLNCFTHFFVQNEQSKVILEKIIPANKITNSGDTRFDRVTAIAQKFEPVPGIEDFCTNHQVIVAGSTWEDDEAEWIHYVKTHPDVRFIIAPHEIDKENLADVRKHFLTSIFYSQWIASEQRLTINAQRTTINDQQSTTNDQRTTINDQQSTNCLIVDNIGMLSRLYKYATVCYVGGGFRSDGLHNILEAAVYGKPVIFGPQFNKNFEAAEMIEHGGAISINNALELEKTLNQLLNDEQELKRKGEAAKNYVHSKAGATERIMEFIRKNAFLPTGQTVSRQDQNLSSQS